MYLLKDIVGVFALALYITAIIDKYQVFSRIFSFFGRFLNNEVNRANNVDKKTIIS